MYEDLYFVYFTINVVEKAWQIKWILNHSFIVYTSIFYFWHWTKL